MHTKMVKFCDLVNQSQTSSLEEQRMIAIVLVAKVKILESFVMLSILCNQIDPFNFQYDSDIISY